MQQTIDRKGEKSMISAEEYLRRRNVIRGKESEDMPGGEEVHSREQKERKGGETKKVNTLKWGAMMELAALMYI